MHWINVVCLVVLLRSGLQIFNAHPALYWGDDSRDSTPRDADHAKAGRRRMARRARASAGTNSTRTACWACRANGERRPTPRARFPPGPRSPARSGWRWAALWHFFFAWLFVDQRLCYLLWTHLQRPPARATWCPRASEWRGIGRSIARPPAAAASAWRGGAALQRAAEHRLPVDRVRACCRSS